MIPKGPAYSGPIRCCIPADIFHSSHTITNTPIVTPTIRPEIEIKIQIDSKESPENPSSWRKSITCSSDSLMTVTVLAINLSHNYIYTTQYCRDISQFHPLH